MGLYHLIHSADTPPPHPPSPNTHFVNPPPPLSGAKGAPSIVLPHQEASYVRHIALDIGGSLIKLVYFSPDNPDEMSTITTSSNNSSSGDGDGDGLLLGGNGSPAAHKGHHHSKGGRMHFVKFETARIEVRGGGRAWWWWWGGGGGGFGGVGVVGGVP